LPITKTRGPKVLSLKVMPPTLAPDALRHLPSGKVPSLFVLDFDCGIISRPCNLAV